MNKEIEELNTWNNPATLSHDEIKALVEKYRQQERERIKKAFFTYLFNNSIEEELRGKFANE